ncbi:MAG: phosphatase [Chromatiales bacterium 21-64-14]|nr:MAG: phosphatase [Chromatiales bacterium 21-64-14]HQU17405.1 protein tyrosine phosphatase family protein [Gammaproteobacteria bacterium]
MSIERITHYLRISERLCSSGQPDEAGFQAIAAAGFSAVINLAMPDSERAIPEEGSIVTELGMSYHHIPVPFDAPGPKHLKRFIGLMEGLKDERVWVHCAANYRVSAFLYLYRRWQGMPEDEARTALLPAWQPNPTWRAFMAQPPEAPHQRA